MLCKNNKIYVIFSLVIECKVVKCKNKGYGN